MTTIKIVILLIIFVTSNIALGHNEFYALDDFNDELIDVTASRSQIQNNSVSVVRWEGYFTNQDKIPLEFTNPMGMATLTTQEVENAWTAAMNTWNNVTLSNETSPFLNVSSNGCDLVILDNSSSFPNANSDGGVTQHAVVYSNGNPTFIVSCITANCQTVNQNSGSVITQTGIAFNNSPDFLSNFVWRWSDTPQGSFGREGVDMQTVALHEMGHVLGLNHCSYQNAVMYASTPANASKRVIQVPDGIGFTN